MFPTRRAPLTLIASVALATALAGCATSAPASTPVATTPVVPSLAPSAAPTAGGATPVATQNVAATMGASPTALASASASPAPVVTIAPGSSLDPALSDAGVAGRITIPDDTRVYSDHFPGTHEVLGREADGSGCAYSFSGDDFTASAQYDDAPVGMLYQMLVNVPADEMPANDGEQRMGILDGRVIADFHSASGIGGSYSGDAGASSNPGSATIDVAVSGATYTFTFTGETWDHVAFNGQVICANVTDS